MHVWLFLPLLWFYILSEFLKQEVCEPMLTTNTPLSYKYKLSY